MRILFLSGWFPYPPINGAKIRIYNMIRQLSRHHEITLLSFTDTMSVSMAREQLPVLAEHCARVQIVPSNWLNPRGLKAYLGLFSPKPRMVFATFNPEMKRVLENELGAHTYDVLIASDVGCGLSVIPYFMGVNQTPKVLDSVEVALIREKYLRQTSPLGRIRYGLTWLKFKRYLGRAIWECEICTVPSEEERRHLLEIFPAYRNVEVVPHGLDLARYKGDFGDPEPNTLAFTGSLIYPVNLDAMQFFLGEVYPIIRSQVPNVALRVMGSTDGVSLGQLAADDSVTFAGLLLDVRLYVAQSWASIAPIRLGAGTRLKIVEAMALGTPVVATSKGAEGLDVTHGENILIADDPASFARHTVELLRNPELRARLAANGRRLVEEKYSAETMGRKMDALLQEVLARRSRLHPVEPTRGQHAVP